MLPEIYTSQMVFGSVKFSFDFFKKNVIFLNIKNNILSIDYFENQLTETIEYSKIDKVERIQGTFTLFLKDGSIKENIISMFPSDNEKKANITFFKKITKEFPSVTNYTRNNATGNIFIEFEDGTEFDYRSNLPPPK